MSLLRCIKQCFLVMRHQSALLEALADKNKDPGEHWSVICAVFSSSATVFAGAVGPTARVPVQVRLLDTLSANHPREAESLYLRGISDTDPMVSAYCLVALHRLGMTRRDGFPQSAFRREDRVRWQSGCLTRTVALSELAREVFEQLPP